MKKLANLLCLAVLILAGISTGCGRSAPPIERAPRPVTVMGLKKTAPGGENLVTGVVGSWKTEAIGFEVAGRVEFVIEPETNFDGEVRTTDNTVLRAAKVLAKLDTERYQNSIDSINLNIETVRRQQEALDVEINDVLPAQRKAAEANFELAKIEVDRNQRLVKQNAAPVRSLDRAKANRDVTSATILEIDSSIKAKEAERVSLDAQIDELKQSLKDAERDLADCELTLPFNGQVAQVHVVPGSFVERGEPVLTAQMMDPIKVEFEVSALRSRELKYKDIVNVIFPSGDGPPLTREAIVYMIDPTADPATRTFTVTLLVRNKVVHTEPPPGMTNESLVSTNEVWRLERDDLMGTGEGSLAVESNAIHGEGEDAYVWRVTNWEAVSSQQTTILEVEKVLVEIGELEMRFLDLWDFSQVSVREGQTFDLKKDVVAGKLQMPKGVESFDGGNLLFDREQWQYRPGDLVLVDQSGQGDEPGFYVPLNAIVEKSGDLSVFVVDSDGDDGPTVRKVPIEQVGDPVNTLQQIRSTGESPLSTDSQIVVDGAHFLVDGEAVKVVEVR